MAELGLTYSYLQLDLVNVTGSRENVATGQQMFVCLLTKRETYGLALGKSASTNRSLLRTFSIGGQTPPPYGSKCQGGKLTLSMSWAGTDHDRIFLKACTLTFCVKASKKIKTEGLFKLLNMSKNNYKLVIIGNPPGPYKGNSFAKAQCFD